jgi:hypothetical protein
LFCCVDSEDPNQEGDVKVVEIGKAGRRGVCLAGTGTYDVSLVGFFQVGAGSAVVCAIRMATVNNAQDEVKKEPMG